MGSEFAGRSVIVTGAARGIGLAIARRFVRAGASVMMADIDEARLEREVEALTAEGYDGRAQAFVGDLREKLAMTNLVAATLDAHDGIDVLVNASRVLVASDPLSPERRRPRGDARPERAGDAPAHPDRRPANDRARRPTRSRGPPTAPSSTSARSRRSAPARRCWPIRSPAPRSSS